MCIVTRKVLDETDLLRFVRSPDGEVVPDLQRKLPGRGVWVGLAKSTVVEAAKRNLFARGFGEQTRIPDGLADTVARLLRQQAVSTLSLARKAGEAIAGFMKVEDALRKGPVAVLLHAPDCGADGVRKLNRLAQPATLISGHFAAQELDLAFGRTNVVHAAVASGRLAEKLVFHIRRFVVYDGLNFELKIGSKDLA